MSNLRVVKTTYFQLFVSRVTAVVFTSLFTDMEIQMIRNMTFHDVLIAVTIAEATDIQNNVFFWRNGKKTFLMFDSKTITCFEFIMFLKINHKNLFPLH